MVFPTLLSVHPIPQVGSVAADLYRVKQSPLRLTTAEKQLVANSIRSVNSGRMQTEGMPSGGWIVDTRSKSCSCAYNRKHAMCCHVISAFIHSGVACPGVSMRTRQFVRPRQVHRFAHADDDSEDSDGQTVAAYPAAAESDPECEDDNDTSNPAGGTLNPAGENRTRSDQMGVPVTTSPAPSTTSVTTTEELEDEDEQQQSAAIAAPAPAVPPARVRSRPRQHSSSRGSIVPTTEAATDSDVVAADRDDNGTAKEIEAALD
ncbi:hypothetical protein PF011_g14035 [Phytophthora fragariae]|uniref:SWIM-type domain-containing protein n=1 Tax=Phytophthora fragariae TaxID=53985 RepID=A0A6A3K3K8_9STRA|nr:hypothetical protein PF011_g14035 [Phytophthora fragariae]